MLTIAPNTAILRGYPQNFRLLPHGFQTRLKRRVSPYNSLQTSATHAPFLH